MAMPRTIERVVCTLWLTMETLVPTSRLTSVDLPALGAPIRATKPQRVVGLFGGPAHRFVDHTPSRKSTAVAAACSASRRLRPSPCPGCSAPMHTLTMKVGA